MEISQISASEAWKLLESSPNAALVDVRTIPEWSFIGTPDTPPGLSKKTILLSWRKYPNMDVNKSFTNDLQKTLPDKDTPILFLCRSGSRSQDAAIAMTQQGYTNCYNIENGFEGDLDMNAQRGTTSGWKAEQLPWSQT